MVLAFEVYLIVHMQNHCSSSTFLLNYEMSRHFHKKRNSYTELNYKKNLQAISIKMADPLILEGDVLQHPTTPVINETNMKKKAVMKSAIIARPISEKSRNKQWNYRLSHIKGNSIYLISQINTAPRNNFFRK